MTESYNASVRPVIEDWLANLAAGTPTDQWLRQAVGKDDAKQITEALAGLDAYHREVEGKADRFAWLSGKIDQLRTRFPEHEEALFGDQAELSGAELGIDAANGLISTVIEAGLQPPIEAGKFFKRIEDFFTLPMGHEDDRDVIRVATVPVLREVRKRMPWMPAGAVACAVDVGVNVVKGAVRVQARSETLEDMAEWLLDRATAAVATALENAAPKIGGKIGSAAGAFLGAFVGMAPLGAKVGMALGTMAGARVAPSLGAAVRSMGESLRATVRTGARWVAEGAKSFVEWVRG